jgi:hypothetical protein
MEKDMVRRDQWDHMVQRPLAMVCFTNQYFFIKIIRMKCRNKMCFKTFTQKMHIDPKDPVDPCDPNDPEGKGNIMIHK